MNTFRFTIALMCTLIISSCKSDDTEYYPYVEDGPIGGRKEKKEIQFWAPSQLTESNNYKVIDTLLAFSTQWTDSSRVESSVEVFSAETLVYMDDCVTVRYLSNGPFLNPDIQNDSLWIKDIEKYPIRPTFDSVISGYKLLPQAPNNIDFENQGFFLLKGIVRDRGGDALTPIDTSYYQNEKGYGMLVKVVTLKIEDE